MQICRYKYRTGLILLWIILGTAFSAQAQNTVKIKGRVIDPYKAGLANVKVFLDHTYDETQTDSTGEFVLITAEKKKQILVTHLEDYFDVKKEITIGNADTSVGLIIAEKIKSLSVVVVTSEKNEIAKTDAASRLLSPTVLLTTVTDGNILSGLRLMPGAQQVGESGQLFFRGGEGYETQLFIDGMQVNSYLKASAPSQSSTSRFPAGLFNGFYFSTGGYSALYGHALSSVLTLETTDLPYRNNGNISVSPLFLGGDITLLNKTGKSAFSFSVNYQDLSFYNKIIRSSLPGQNFERPPRALEFYGRYMVKLPKNGLLKIFSSASTSNLSFGQTLLEDETKLNIFDLYNPSLINIIQIRQPLKKWKTETAFSWSRNSNRVHIDTVTASGTLRGPRQQINNSLLQGRTVWNRELSSKLTFFIGAEGQWYKDIYIRDEASINLIDQLTSAFAETKWYGGGKWYATTGLRVEHSSILHKANIAPRINLFLKSGDKGQFLFAYGHFYQTPQNDFLLQKSALRFQKSIHYVFGYQTNWDRQNLRGEVFYKKYDHLVNLRPKITSNGYGYASGFDFFWRDKKKLKDFEYWVSYSFLKSRRKYLNYPVEATPAYAPEHTTSVVLKKFFMKPSIIISSSYTYSSGRTYYNPNQPSERFLSDKTRSYNNCNLNLSYLTKIKGAFSVVVLTLSNVFGSNQVFGYSYSTINPLLRREISPLYKRFLFVGLFITFGIDRRDEAVNSQL